MKMWMLNTVCVLALSGFSALAEIPVSHGDALLTSNPKSIVAPTPNNPAENKTGRIAEVKDACNLSRPSADATIDNAFSRILR